MNKATFLSGVSKIVTKHGLQIQRHEDRPRDTYYETIWVPRAVLAEEEARGVTGARNRIVLRGRPVEGGFGTGGEYYRVTWEVQNQVRSVTTTDWHPGLIPAEVVKEFRPIFTELVMETRTGMQR